MTDRTNKTKQAMANHDPAAAQWLELAGKQEAPMRNATFIRALSLKPGDHVELVGMAGRWFEVINTDDPALVKVRTDTGKEFSAGRACVTQARRP